MLAGAGLGAPRLARWRALRTVYAVTDRRAIVLRVQRDGGRDEHDYRPDEVSLTRRRDRADDAGDILFENTLRQRPGNRSGSTTHGFHAVARAREIDRLLRRTFAGR